MRWPDRLVRAIAAIAVVPMLTPALLLGLPAAVLAASPAPTQVVGGDPRSSGQGPGLVGDPLTAILLVAGIAILSVAATLLYVRLTGGRASSGDGAARRR